MSDNQNIECSKCNQIFTRKKNLYAHLRNIHKTEPLSKTSPQLACELCDRKFSCKSTLSRHVKTIHNVATDHDYGLEPTARKTRLFCPYESCKTHFLTNLLLRDHLCSEHNVEIQIAESTFDSIEEFEQWRSEMQRETLSMYTLETAPKELRDGTKKRYYSCHRSYSHKRQGNDTRALKSMGTNKIGKACPSRLEVIESERDGITTVSTKFWKTHCGHSMDIGRIAIDKATRAEIAGKLRQGVSFEHILDTIRDNAVSSEDSRRLSLLERKDIHNIVRDFKIDYATKRHQNDAISIKLWVEEMQSLGEESPVLYYKGQNEQDSTLRKEDFALILMTNFQAQQVIKFGQDKICIDGTHGTNAYDIQLYTIMTVDEFGSGCPVAFCFSNRSDEEIFKLFFEQIRAKVGTIEATVFMSDDAPAFYNAWASVMGIVPNRLLCTWHIDKNWRQNLNKISGGSEKKALVYKTLRVLLQLTSVDDFHLHLDQILQDLLEDSDTKAFGEYFRSYYYQRPKSWAYCYRLGLGINTNMYLESYHKSLKHIYLQGKKVKRLDKSVDAVMKLARDSFFKRLIKLSKHSPTEKVKRIHNSHKASATIDVEKIEILEEQKEWIVPSSTNPMEKYHVIKAQDTCDEPCLKCTYCNICVHTFKCSCTDNLIKMNICKHIHACAREFLAVPIGLDVSQNEINNNEIEDLFQFQEKLVRRDNTANEKIIKKTEHILGLIGEVTISDKSAKLIETQLDRVIHTLNQEKMTHLDPVEDVNVQKKIEKQTRLVSTKKSIVENNMRGASVKATHGKVDNKELKSIGEGKARVNEKARADNVSLYSTKKRGKKGNNVLQKPSLHEKNAIMAGISNSASESINIHTGTDHSYNVNC